MTATTETKPSTNIRALRKLRGMTLKDLAEAIGTTPQTVQRLETGNMTVNLDWLFALAQALGVPPSRLIADPDTLAPDADFIDMVQAAAMRSRRSMLVEDLPLGLLEASGRLAETVLHAKSGAARWAEVQRAAASVAAVAMRISIDADPGREASPALKLVSGA